MSPPPPASQSKLIESKLEDRILYLTFEDQSSRNSFSLRAADELSSHLKNNLDECDAVIFKAHGRVFCSGGNLTDYANMSDPAQGIEVNRKIAAALDELSQCPKPTVCVVDGDCFGGGVELISSFDFVFSSPGAFFALWQRKIGLSFGWGGGKRLEMRLGLKTLRQLALSTELLSAQKACRIGLIDSVCLKETLQSEAKRKAQELMCLPKNPIAAIKTWHSENEKTVFEGLWWNDEHREVLQGRKKS